MNLRGRKLYFFFPFFHEQNDTRRHKSNHQTNKFISLIPLFIRAFIQKLWISFWNPAQATLRYPLKFPRDSHTTSPVCCLLFDATDSAYLNRFSAYKSHLQPTTQSQPALLALYLLAYSQFPKSISFSSRIEASSRFSNSCSEQLSCL